MARKDISDAQVVYASSIYNARCWGSSIEMQLRGDPRPFVNEILQQLTGEPIKVCDVAMRRAWTRGFIDWGVSMRTAFPTEEGLAMLERERSD